MAYCDFKDLPRRTTFDKVSRDKAVNIAKNAKYGYERGLASAIYRSVDQILEGVNNSSGAAIKS